MVWCRRKLLLSNSRTVAFIVCSPFNSTLKAEKIFVVLHDSCIVWSRPCSISHIRTMCVCVCSGVCVCVWECCFATLTRYFIWCHRSSRDYIDVYAISLPFQRRIRTSNHFSVSIESKPYHFGSIFLVVAFPLGFFFCWVLPPIISPTNHIILYNKWNGNMLGNRIVSLSNIVSSSNSTA